MSPAAPVIEVRGLRKRFGGFEAVRGLDLTVERGEVLAILGPNGAGKTTTVEILEGYLERDAGEVSVLGHDPSGAPRALRRRIGIVLQEAGIDRFLTCREVLQQHANFYAAPRDPDELLELVGLTEKAGERVKRLSGGQQRRLDLALGMVGNPELIFLDEPTTGFDPQARRQAWDIVSKLAEGGTTILLTTHYLDEAQALADRVVVFSAGQVVESGTPDELANRTGLTRISFSLAGGATPPNVDGLLRDGDHFTLQTPRPTAVLHELTAWAVGAGLELGELAVARPSLEDTYLSLIDHETELAAAEAAGA
ncbi:MAG: ABC transporter ATP-binding protein [Solirubrobacteraceae bacterium]|nr:ABC transporter ATP-binding protein [Solirubrobacteraceae bacterium]